MFNGDILGKINKSFKEFFNTFLPCRPFCWMVGDFCFNFLVCILMISVLMLSGFIFAAVFSFGFLAVFKWLECSCDKIDFEFGDGWNVHGMSMEAFTRYSMETYIR